MTIKELIFDKIKEKFSESGVTKLILSFYIENEKYTIYVMNEENKKMSIDIELKEVSMIKLMFLNKIKKKYYQENKQPLKTLIVQVDFNTEVFEIFTENDKGQVYKFEY